MAMTSGCIIPRFFSNKKKWNLECSLPKFARLLWSGLLTHELVWSKVTVIFSTSNTAVACTFIISVGSHFGSVWTSGILIILSFHQCALYTGQCTASSHRLCRVLTGNHYS